MKGFNLILQAFLLKCDGPGYMMWKVEKIGDFNSAGGEQYRERGREKE